jgi:hypothetical protein
MKSAVSVFPESKRQRYAETAQLNLDVPLGGDRLRLIAVQLFGWRPALSPHGSGLVHTSNHL